MQKRIEEWVRIAKPNLPTTPQFPATEDFHLFLELMLEELTECAVSGNKADMAAYMRYLDRVRHKVYEKWLKLEESGTDKERDFNEFRDGMGDLQVVHHNGVTFAGMNELFPWDMEEIMDSNFSKYCALEEDAMFSVEAYANGLHPDKKGEKIECYYEKRGDYFVILRKDNNKIMKSVHTFKPHLK